MKRRITHQFLWISLTFCFAVSAYGQGIYWESKEIGSPMGDKSDVARFYYMPRMFKVILDEGGRTIIFRLDKQLMITVDNADKTYTELTFAELEKTMKKAGAQMEEMKKKMADLPEEQRKMMEQMMGDGGVVEVKATGEKKSISGYACSKYVVTKNGKESIAVWTTKDVKGFDSMRKDMEEFGRLIAELNPMMGKEMAEGMKKIEGFPIQTDMGSIKSVVTKVEKRASPPSEFDVPSGYKKVKPKMMEGMNEE